MSGQRRTGRWITGVLGLAVAVTAGLIAWGGRRGALWPPVVFNEQTPLPTLTGALREGDARALSALYQRITAKTNAAPKGLGEAEAAEWLDTLAGLRTGFLKFGGYGRSSALSVTTKVLDRFAIEPAPECWLKALAPVHDLLASGLADPHLNVRIAALVEVSRLWGWMPGRSMIGVEVDYLADWKDGLIAPVVRRLADPEPKARVAAVACLGTLPLDKVAAPAIPYLEDPSGDVRQQVLISFARRPDLLSTDAIIKRLYDQDPGIPQLAETVLKTRGLTPEQIDLARMISHPKPELRASIIPMLRNRAADDIDPAVWLLQLSQDREASVRLAAVEALAGRVSPEVRDRLAEMASSDQSPDVRRAAAKLIAPGTETATTLPLPRPRHERAAASARSESETTVALPPLPGSLSLNPKAN
jgi:HEAT repeat protein